MITNNIITEEFNELLRMRTFISKEKQAIFLESLGDDFRTPPVKDPMAPEGKALDMILDARLVDDDSNNTVVAMNALKIDPDCIDAYNLLGESEADDHKSTAYYKKGIEIAKRKLGHDFFKENRGLFCSIPETRSYMSCLAGYASNLDSMKRYRHAIQIYEQMLTLNIKDHMSARFPLMLDLIRTGEYRKFKRYEARFINDEIIYTIFNRVLFYFKTTGDSKKTNDLLNEAMGSNKHVVPSLISLSKIRRLPDQNDQEFMWGCMYSLMAKNVWIDATGAINWLRGKIN